MSVKVINFLKERQGKQSSEALRFGYTFTCGLVKMEILRLISSSLSFVQESPTTSPLSTPVVPIICCPGGGGSSPTGGYKSLEAWV